jgi:hypothetical protein
LPTGSGIPPPHPPACQIGLTGHGAVRYPSEPLAAVALVEVRDIVSVVLRGLDLVYGVPKLQDWLD